MSTLIRHGLNVGVERIDDSVYLTLSVVGSLTHQDYQTITPMLDNAVAGIAHPQINVLIDAREFTGWEARAAWDDFKLGMKHRKEFQRVAIVGNKDWERTLVKIAGWFVHGEARFFEGYDDAASWVCEH